jgi:cytochrome c oxidase subunit 3
VSVHAEAHDTHAHPPTAHISSRVDARVLGMFLFIASEIMLFGSFFTAYFFVRVVNQAPEWPPCKVFGPGGGCVEHFHLPVFVAGINSAILLTSSGTMHWALTSIKRGNRAGMQAGLVLTFLMGFTFLATQITEYARIGFAPHDHAFATIFFGLTGLHGAHVFVGLSILLAMTVRAFRGHFSPEHHHGVEIGGIYWHFVDAMWIVVYTTVYII